MCSIKNKFVYSNLKPETLAKNKFCCFLYHSQNFHSQTLNRAAMLTTMLRQNTNSITNLYYLPSDLCRGL